MYVLEKNSNHIEKCEELGLTQPICMSAAQPMM